MTVEELTPKFDRDDSSTLELEEHHLTFAQFVEHVYEKIRVLFDHLEDAIKPLTEEDQPEYDEATKELISGVYFSIFTCT